MRDQVLIPRLLKFLTVLLICFFTWNDNASANGWERLGFFKSFNGKLDFTGASTYGDNWRSVTISGIPAGATVKKAYFYTVHYRYLSSWSVYFNGRYVTARPIGGENWWGGRFWWFNYRTDVTPYVTGNGNYTVGFSGQLGCSLLVIYEDPSLEADYQLEVHDGLYGGSNVDTMDGTWPWANRTRFTGFTVDGTVPPEAQIGYSVQSKGNCGIGYRFEGSDLECCYPLPLYQGKGSQWRRFNVSPHFSGGETTAWANLKESSTNYWDHALWLSTVLRVRTTSPITDVTPPELDIVSHADRHVVSSSPQTVTATVRDESGTTVTSVPELVWSPNWLPPPEGQASAVFALGEGDNELTVTARDDLGLETSKPLNIVLDTGVPAVTITAPADQAILDSGTVLLAATVVDDTATRVVSSPAGIDQDLAPGGGTVGTTLSLPDGVHVLSINATDEAEHVGGSSVNVTVDTVPPAVTIQSPISGVILGELPITISVDVVDTTATMVTIGSSTYLLPTGSGTVSGNVTLAEGTSEVPVSAVDAAGNVGSDSISLTLDLSAPLVTIDSPAPGSLFGAGQSPVPVTATVNDVTITTVDSDPDGVSGTLPAGGGLITGAIPLDEGSNTLTVTATDQTAREGSDSVAVVYDTTPPTIDIVSPQDDSAVRGLIDFHAEVADVAPGSGVSQVDFLVDTGVVDSLTVGPYETSVDTTTLPDATHTMTIQASDGLGNAGTASVSVLVDNTEPVLSILNPVSGQVLGGDVDFVVSASDGGSWLDWAEMLVAGNPPNVVDASIVYPVAQATDLLTSLEDSTFHYDGPLTFQATVQDVAGNQASASVTITVDNTAPEWTLLKPTDGSVVSGEIAIEAAAMDANLDTIEIFVDGVSHGVSYTSPFSVLYDTVDRLDGQMVITVVSTDLAGNTSACTAHVTVDNIAVGCSPNTLNLKSKGKNKSVTVHLEGPNVAMLIPTESSAIELRIPGGNPVPSTPGFSGDDAVTDDDGDGIPELTVKFDRQLLITSVRAGIASGKIDPTSTFALTVMSGGTFQIGEETIRVVGS